MYVAGKPAVRPPHPRPKAAAPKPAAPKNPSRGEIENLLNTVADQYGIPRPILKAIARQESGWRQYDSHGHILRGHSTPNDQGIMQINEKAHPEAFPRARTDIRYNMQFAAAYLKELHDQYHDWPKALAAYNAGSPRCKKDKKGHKVFVNQPYVDRVLKLAKDFGLTNPIEPVKAPPDAD